MDRRATRRIITATAVAALAAGGTLLVAGPAQATPNAYHCPSVTITSSTTLTATGCSGGSVIKPGPNPGPALITTDAGSAYRCTYVVPSGSVGDLSIYASGCAS